MTEKITRLQNIVENPEQYTNLENEVLQICSIEASKQNLSQLSLSMEILQELYNYCQKQLESPHSEITRKQLQAISNILKQNLQLQD